MTTVNGITGTKPRHIAIVMDGNGRWARQRHLPRVAGHSKGAGAVRQIVEWCARNEIPFLTLFAFSTENWRRPPEEVSRLMRLFRISLRRELNLMRRNNIRLQVIGDLQGFDDGLQALIQRAVEATARNTGLTLSIAANYGGRWDIVQAVRKAVVRLNTIQAGSPRGNEASAAPTASSPSVRCIQEQLSLGDVPAPDLFIRTGGEKRLSNFLLWQLAETHLHFTDCLWPDFSGEILAQVVTQYFSPTQPEQSNAAA